jgi:hypothetical protein
MINNGDFRKALETASSELSDLVRDRTAIDLRITQLKTAIDTLTALLEEKAPYVSGASWESTAEVLNELGISDAVRRILADSAAPMFPTQVKAALVNAGFPLEEYASAMSVIHNTLKRLERQGELITVRSPSGQAAAYATQLRAEHGRAGGFGGLTAAGGSQRKAPSSS